MLILVVLNPRTIYTTRAPTGVKHTYGHVLNLEPHRGAGGLRPVADLQDGPQQNSQQALHDQLHLLRDHRLLQGDQSDAEGELLTNRPLNLTDRHTAKSDRRHDDGRCRTKGLITGLQVDLALVSQANWPHSTKTIWPYNTSSRKLENLKT